MWALYTPKNWRIGQRGKGRVPNFCEHHSSALSAQFSRPPGTHLHSCNHFTTTICRRRSPPAHFNQSTCMIKRKSHHSKKKYFVWSPVRREVTEGTMLSSINRFTLKRQPFKRRGCWWWLSKDVELNPSPWLTRCLVQSFLKIDRQTLQSRRERFGRITSNLVFSGAQKNRKIEKPTQRRDLILHWSKELDLAPAIKLIVFAQNCPIFIDHHFSETVHPEWCRWRLTLWVMRFFFPFLFMAPLFLNKIKTNWEKVWEEGGDGGVPRCLNYTEGLGLVWWIYRLLLTEWKRISCFCYLLSSIHLVHGVKYAPCLAPSRRKSRAKSEHEIFQSVKLFVRRLRNNFFFP